MLNPNISVIYNAWHPFGIFPFQSFITSYQKNTANAAHQLVIIFKDFPENDIASDEPFLNLLKEMNIDYSSLHFKGGLDIDAYFFAANQLNTEYCCFFNTKSIILAPNWLNYMYQAIQDNSVGVVSATGSWQSYMNTVYIQNSLRYNSKESFKTNFRKYKLYLKAFFYYRFLFPSFPNPHVRTNAFLIKKETFLKLHYKPITKKIEAYQFESGWNGFTRQLQKMGLIALIVDNKGNAYPIDKWNKSNIFWQSNQEALLVSDNQTNAYNVASETERKTYRKLAWGI